MTAFVYYLWTQFRNLKGLPVIQRFIAVLLLVVFMTGSAPKSFFHDLVADHVDIASCNIDHESAVLHQHHPECGFDDLVVPLPFVLLGGLSLKPLGFYPEHKPSYYSAFSFQSFQHHLENRGPPSI